MIQSFDWSVRWWQPYVLLSTGNRRAEETLLLDYIPLNHFYVIYYAFKYKHALIVLSTISALGSYILQPLAGSLFSVRMLPKTLGERDGSANSIRSIGLSPEVSDLNAFASSAGQFAEASVFNGLPDPPFVLENWSTAQFVFPTGDMLNGSVAVNTTAIQTNVNCANPLGTTLTTTNPANFSINATSVDGCGGGPAFFDPANAGQQYGVQAVANCGSGSTNASFQPVMFWYYTTAANGTHEARTVFCNPQIQLFDVMAYADLASGALTSVTTLGDYPKPNNVSGAPLNGNAYNGLIFDPSNDINVQARATATKAGIPNAIFRGAAQNSSGLQSSLTTIMDSAISQAAYIPLSAHFLTAILILEALTILYIHIRHHRARRRVVTIV
ncbi:hypothetical protein EWM64_g7186 [Hericium alpestre]|uniref:Uncharacterized protein n=1 Tax=Hericium alpestre TaxID=135208 RepID=A0A4Y9ZQF3_9AGAM|nr:hypothetical protein EWM64_g7186 [Hericium alpestre]